ncbi:MAG: hypothetical protein N5P05_002956 [Chroococcopsis gigantea SAG 12.99]|jgi:twitching motility protein PilJ|nr:HAMP domain-containing protein [Chlorogloea purpurea SAG 13.99]MDV3001350.1 hypothetical protein [Chroococcopsis gigantea SAG 12.99]
MPLGNDYVTLYGQANAAYCQGNLDEANRIIESMLGEYPDDPNILLLQGHINLGRQEYKAAQRQYEKVLQLAKASDQSDLVDYARRGLEQARHSQLQDEFSSFDEMEATEGITFGAADFKGGQSFASQESAETVDWQPEEFDWGNGLFNEADLDEPTVGQPQPYVNPFDHDDQEETAFHGTPSGYSLKSQNSKSAETFHEGEEFQWEQDTGDETNPFPFFDGNAQPNHAFASGGDFYDEGESTFMVSGQLNNSSSGFSRSSHPGMKNNANQDNLLHDLSSFPEDDLEGISGLDITDVAQSMQLGRTGEDSGLNSSLPNNTGLNVAPSQTQINWSTQIEDQEQAYSAERLLKPTTDVTTGKLGFLINAPLKTKRLIVSLGAGLAPILIIFAVTAATGLSTSPSKPVGKAQPKTAQVQKSQGKISPLSQPVLLMMLLSGATSFGLTWLLGQLMMNRVERSINDLRSQCDKITDGDFNAKALIYSQDESGLLAHSFNQMVKVIATTTREAQQRASETEQAKEDLQRQVIRLLDDVEGAARGDLTVQAEVTPDVLGAVADAFNLTIQNLREIVRQVKQAAKQVNKGSTDSESYARNQSSDALRMAEELAVTLNSVQMMTESIQRVAENAREAEEVARTSSITALKGGESVERTVSGILQIRETVSETARKVKRLAEASQEISKIVAVISQIASRTNLLALNASIQSARAGEAGRGFAIVADEVRQLADRSAKSLKEIEQIVLQIQSETGSVMTAMEEGIQQVLDVTERSEQAKKSLEDIIQVSNRIDSLVRSITGDTVKQRENSREVAQVMQSVELTAQETSQESQRVAGSLQKLVGISRDLLSSIEKFRVEEDDAK